MPNTRPKTWYEYHASKFEADTSHLSCEEVGAYQRLLNFHFLNGYIPGDLDVQKRILRESRQKTLKIFSVLKSFFYEENGNFYQKRMMETIAKGVDISRKRKAAGRKGGEANAKANAIANGQAKEKTVTDTDKDKDKDQKTPPAAASEVDFKKELFDKAVSVFGPEKRSLAGRLVKLCDDELEAYIIMQDVGTAKEPVKYLGKILGRLEQDQKQRERQRKQDEREGRYANL
jgi:uncharacterized protein YdaU (DUF1376 family)